jgi:hypothetical protein
MNSQVKVVEYVKSQMNKETYFCYRISMAVINIYY